jgi:hypothetical protein
MIRSEWGRIGRVSNFVLTCARVCETLASSLICFSFPVALADKLARHAELHDAPFLIVANKCDDEVDGSGATAGALTVDELVRALPILIPPPTSSASSSLSSSSASAASAAASSPLSIVDADASQLRPTRLVQLIPISAKSGCVICRHV